MWLKKNWNIISIAILAVAAAWVIFTAMNFELEKSVFTIAAREGFLAPDFELDTLSGETERLSSMQGQIVIVNFWASWCQPCRTEMPAIQGVYEAGKEGRVQVLAVNTTGQDDLGRVAQFVQEKELTFPILLDRDGVVAQQYSVRALPTTFIIDADGIIHKMIVGGPLPEALLSSQIEQLSGEAR